MVSRQLSVVDYEAWGRGYVPPAEHALVHHLSTGHAKVIMASHGTKAGYWLVTVDGRLPNRKTRLALFEMLDILCEDEAQDIHPLAAENTAV